MDKSFIFSILPQFVFESFTAFMRSYIVKSAISSEGVEIVGIKKRAKVLGVIIARCPVCDNPINFDRVSEKVCPYCEQVVLIERDKVEVILRSSGKKVGKKFRVSLN